MPPISPITCLGDKDSLNNVTDNIILNTKGTPLTTGKNNWLGIIPDIFRLTKCMVKVQIPQIILNSSNLLLQRVGLSYFLPNIKEIITEHKNAENKNPPDSVLYTED